MGALILLLTVTLLWTNLIGAGLAASQVTRDYGVARVAGPIALCLAAFFLEHFWGWGAHPVLLPFSTGVSLWLIWRHRVALRADWRTELFFAAGFFYCLVWRFAFPDIDTTSDRMPSLALIEGYMQGTTLPAPDRWFWPYRANVYYSFQHYAAAFLGRSFGVVPGLAYHLGYCTLAGLITTAAGGCIARLCPWRWGGRIALLALVVGGSGAAVAMHALLKGHSFVLESVRFLGGSMVDRNFNPAGRWVVNAMMSPGVVPRDLPMEPLSYVLINGDYHTPLAGHLLLALACLLIATLECGGDPGSRRLNHALLAATVPLALISNAWIFPLQFGLVLAWLVYRSCCGERSHWGFATLGVFFAGLLEYPALRDFMQQGITSNAVIRWTESVDHTPWLGWLLIFWPVVGIMLLGLWNREHRRFVWFLIVVWSGALFCTEFLYNDDMYGGAWNRFNTTMKWWPWVYAGVILTLGALNLGARSRFCRYGTCCFLLPTCIYGVDLGRHFLTSEKPALGQMDGRHWLDRDPVVKQLIDALSSLPDGVTVQSGLKSRNTESPAVSLFSRKQSLLGWPWLELAWRGADIEIDARNREIQFLYANELPDPVGWLLTNQVRYVLWLPLNNAENGKQLRPLSEKIKSRYLWRQFWAGDGDAAIGFWERIDPAVTKPAR